MKNAILIVGNALQENDLLLDYILRHYKNHFNSLADTFFSPKTDPNLPFLLEKLFSEYAHVLIYAHEDSFTLINKIISTLNEDNLSLKDGILLPSKVTTYQKDSYAINLNRCKINVLHIKNDSKLPNILHNKSQTSSNIHLIGIDEQSCELLLEPLKRKFETNISITPLAQGWIKIKATSKKEENIINFNEEMKQSFNGKIFIANNPMQHIITQLQKHNKIISLAESCTGGLLASLFTKIPGSSLVFHGGLVTYSNEIKSSWLGVDERVLSKHGAVSEAVVTEMLDGSLKASSSNMAMAISGIAGPSGGSEEKPVGTVFIGVANDEGKFLVERLNLKGDRNYIQAQSAYSCLRLLLDLEKEIFLTDNKVGF